MPGIDENANTKAWKPAILSSRGWMSFWISCWLRVRWFQGFITQAAKAELAPLLPAAEKRVVTSGMSLVKLVDLVDEEPRCSPRSRSAGALSRSREEGADVLLRRELLRGVEEEEDRRAESAATMISVSGR